MSAVIVQCTCLLAAIALPGVTCLGCAPGWFGDRCQFKCHCAKSVYCGNYGECPGIENCAPGYFGVGCQYVDLAYLHALPNNSRYLYDQDDRSCNDDPQSTSVFLALNESMPASWYRIAARDQKKILLFTLAINKYYRCKNEKRHLISSFIMDVVCEEGSMVRDVTIIGEIAPFVCSIYISGGRNMALRQFANQSTTYWRLSDASNAVDGNKDNNFERGSCARTNSGLQQSWTIYFEREIKPLRAVLYNSGVGELHRFTLKTFNSRNVEVHSHLDYYRHPQPVYEVILISAEPIVKLQILGTTDYPAQRNNLHFCEIEVYGDHVCPDQKYGVDCSKDCLCAFWVNCSHMTGICIVSCPDGTYGSGCKDQCGSNCLDRKCDAWAGVCYYCTSGSAGDFCVSETKSTPDSTVSYLWSLVPILMVMVITPVIFYVFLYEKRKRAQSTEPPATDEEPQPPHEEPQPPQMADVDSIDNGVGSSI